MEDYKKKYENALNAARKFKNDCPSLWDTKSNPFKGVFEELEESEDERIRKALIHYFSEQDGILTAINGNVSIGDILAWLEKQVEQKPQGKQKLFNNDKYQTVPVEILDRLYESEKELEQLKQVEQKPDDKCICCNNFKGCITCTDGDQYAYITEQKPTDNLEPKFKVGDWITDNNSTFQIVRVENEWYHADDGDKICFDVAHQYYHLWTIKDAKDGDVLTTKNFIFIFKNIDNDNGVRYYCHYEISNNEEDNLFEVSFPQCVMGRVGNGLSYYSPATEEQCNLLFSKMKEAGYKWDAEKKELKKIEQKPAWSEEDEERLSDAVFFVREYQIPTRDKRLLNTAKEAEKWLKSLKERYTWKPSDEQIDGIECAIKTLQHQLNVEDKRLDSLYNDLKKLKG